MTLATPWGTRYKGGLPWGKQLVCDWGAHRKECCGGETYCPVCDVNLRDPNITVTGWPTPPASGNNSSSCTVYGAPATWTWCLSEPTSFLGLPRRGYFGNPFTSCLWYGGNASGSKCGSVPLSGDCWWLDFNTDGPFGTISLAISKYEIDWCNTDPIRYTRCQYYLGSQNAAACTAVGLDSWVDFELTEDQASSLCSGEQITLNSDPLDNSTWGVARHKCSGSGSADAETKAELTMTVQF